LKASRAPADACIEDWGIQMAAAASNDATLTAFLAALNTLAFNQVRMPIHLFLHGYSQHKSHAEALRTTVQRSWEQRMSPLFTQLYTTFPDMQ
jgi:hypothetical protein